MTNVKWLDRIEVVDAPFTGYQQTWAYRLRQTQEDEGVPLDRMLPRALLIPPGIPDFMTRQRLVAPGPCRVEGRAWSGHAPVSRVELSTDGGRGWQEVALDEDDLGSRWAWRGWQALWEPPGPGRYRLGCRASDEAGNEQPVEGGWNLGGYANNAVQWVDVVVREP
jgi:sulfane dehydrogenase subunit SoxC